MPPTPEISKAVTRFVELDEPFKKIFDVAPEPTGGYVRDLRAHVRAHGTPDTWRWHLHTKPPKGGPPPVLIAKNIDVPEALRAAVGLAPCPLCCLTAPKYFYGILTWWPEEQALRVIGIECARKIFGEAFDREVIRFDRQQKASADLDFLIEALPMVAPMRAFLEELVPIAVRLDRLRGRVLKGLSKTIAKALYKHAVANKGLVLFEERWVDKDTGRERLPVSVARFPLDGFDILSDWRQNPSALLDAGGRLLTGLGCENEDQIIDTVGRMGDDGMARARSAIVDAGRFFGTARERCASIQAFLSTDNIDRLMQWSFDHRAELHLDIRKDDFGAAVFTRKPHRVSVPLNAPELTLSLPSAPAFENLSKLYFGGALAGKARTVKRARPNSRY